MEILISNKLYLPEKLRNSIYRNGYIGKDEVNLIHHVLTKNGHIISKSCLYRFVFNQGGIPESKREIYQICINYIRNKNKFYLNFKKSCERYTTI